jgi:thiosulfate reductase cytochrome b subunit
MTVHTADPPAVSHARWVRGTHWVIAVSFVALAVTGFVILMAHPRLYWGEVGNDLTPALLELPISRNHKHGGWEAATPFFEGADAPVTANRTADLFNQNAWARSLHFLAGWFLVATGGAYLLMGAVTGHFRRHLVPRPSELTPRLVADDLRNHLRFRIPAATGGPQYGLLQRCAYVGVVFVALPLATLTGLAMSPAVTAAYPVLLDIFGGVQSARTIHFFLWVALVLFLAAHVVMVIASGFRTQMKGMTVGDRP